MRADDPKTPLGWLFGVDRWHGAPIYAILAGTTAATSVMRDFCEAWLPPGIGGAVGAFVSMLPFTVMISAFASKPPEVSVPDPAPGETHLSTVKVAFEERSLGEDRGMVAFSEGWFLFEGRRTLFALGRADVRGVRNIGEETRLDLNSGHQLRLSGDLPLRAALAVWMAEPSATGISRLPPTDAHPQKRMRAATLLHLVSAGTLGLAISIVVRSLPVANHPILTLKIAAFMLAIACLSTLGGWFVARRVSRIEAP